MIKESRTSIPARNIEEFIIVFKYLAFVACAARAPITERLLDETLDLIGKAGLAENIRKWCLWTPTQLCLMEMADEMPRIALTGGSGTGKTTMLETYAIEIATKNPLDIIIFAIQQWSSICRPLLQILLEVRFEMFPNVTVETFEELCDLDLERDASTHIFIDELDVFDEPLKGDFYVPKL